MSDYDWKTEMRASDPGTRTDGLALGARTDGLHGQAAARVHVDRRVTLVCMPDAGCFPADATISAEDADRLIRVIWAQRLAAIEQYRGTEATKIKAILYGTGSPAPLKGSTSCRRCGRWLEGAWNHSTDDDERAELQRQMDAGRCDACTAKETTTP
jgi:hypothetical protein